MAFLQDCGKDRRQSRSFTLEGDGEVSKATMRCFNICNNKMWEREPDSNPSATTDTLYDFIHIFQFPGSLCPPL